MLILVKRISSTHNVIKKIFVFNITGINMGGTNMGG